MEDFFRIIEVGGHPFSEVLLSFLDFPKQHKVGLFNDDLSREKFLAYKLMMIDSYEDSDCSK